jgi:hypothetical protein
VFGDGAVRALATQAREELIERVERLLGAEAERYRALVRERAPEPAAAAALRSAAADLESARRASSEVSRPAALAPPPPSPEPPPKVPWWRRVFEG